MGVFPVILVPVFAVRVSVLLHVLALGRLARGATAGRSATVALASKGR